MILFSLSDVRLIADPSVFSLGYDLNEAAMSDIKSVSMASDDIMQILSTTQGSKLYKQTVNIYTQDEGVKIIGKCSCEIGRNCKHVVSSAMAYLDEVSLKEMPPVSMRGSKDEQSDWLSRLESAFSVDKPEPSGKSSLLLYELNLSKSEEEIELSLYTARELKGGGYGKVNRARPNTVFNTYKPPEYFKDNDKETVLLFKTLSQGLKTTVTLQGKLGALVLEGAVSTGRCFWKRGHKKALGFSDERSLGLAWKEEGRNTFLSIELGENTHLISVDPLYYIDTKNKEVGQVKTELSSEQLELLAKAPKFPTESIEEIALSIASKIPQLSIKEPQSLDLQDIVDATLRPSIHLKQSKESYKIGLTFIYDDMHVKAFPYFDTQTFMAERLKIKRDKEQETFFIDILKSYGFKEHNNDLIAHNIQTWKSLLEAQETLIEMGFEIIKDKGFNLNFHAVEQIGVKVEQTSHWFDVGMHIMVDDQRLPLLPIVSKLLNEGIDLDSKEDLCFEVEPDRYISISTQILEPIIKTFYELLDKPNSEGFRLRKYEAQVFGNFSSDRFNIQDTTDLRKLSDEIQKRHILEDKSKGLKATLRSYQEEGVAWMQFLRRYGFGGVLADDMGLGKTLQTLAHLQIEKESDRFDKPALIVAPTSLLGNWKAEASKFTPNLRVALYYGSSRKDILDNINDFDLIITSYTLLSLDIDSLKKKKFYYLILDEAQKIKNARSESAKSAKLIDTQYHLALSGTPMENHLGELHSIFDTVMPDFLGSLKEFKALYQNPIEKEHSSQAQERLNSRIRPFMLRRTKDKVAKELPLKTEIIRSVSFESDQAQLYETIRVSMEKSVRESIKSMGLAKSHITILAALLKLRQVCCDPRLLKIEEAQKAQESAKLEMLMELVQELREEGRRILIFSQFTSMLEIIEEQMMDKAISYSKLTGSTLKRQEQINRFNEDKTDVFLISLKAGGVGLNLTKADVVIHYDPWWNPAAQDQATDRAYRIGQDKPVFVYKLIVENSVEEKIVQMQESKKALAEAIYEGKEQGFSKMDEKDLLELFT
ncbi:SNF2-related protein [Campylobacterota bacterium]